MRVWRFLQSTLDVAFELMVARQMMSLKRNRAITTELMVTYAMLGVICGEAALISVTCRLFTIIALF